MKILFIQQIPPVHAIVIIAMLVSGCTAKVDRYPTLEDHKDPEDPIRADISPDNIGLLNAMSFTEVELELIVSRGDTEELIGAGIQASGTGSLGPSDLLGLDILLKATEKDAGNPLAWAALIGQEAGVFAYGKDTGLGTDTLRHIDTFESVDPDNALPLFYRAMVYFHQGRLKEAGEEMVRTQEKKRFDTYDTRMRKALIRAAESLGFSEFSARYYGLSIRTGISTFPEFARNIIVGNVVGDEAVNAILRLARLMEVQSRLDIERLVSYSIQFSALEKLGAYDGIGALNAKVTSFREKKKLMSGDALTNIPEHRWVEFYDEVLESGEQQALERLYSEFGKQSHE
ncbi:MAG TPA: hypothetical protein ENI12_06135 [Nitrospirae bacterium]|nr:hypothetical protein [Nitrospirota bacterium]